MEINIFFDGGSKNNQSQNRQGYGSFITLHNGAPVTMTIDRGTKNERKTLQCFLDFGQATNNEAEWKTFLTALCYALELQEGTKKELTFIFHGDSQNVLGPFLDGNKVKAANLKPLYEEAQALISALIQVKFVKETGVHMKEVLGH